MKKCLYCAEEIQDDAVVCRYCGHDLQLTPKERAPQASKPSSSVWRKGAKISAVFTALAAISIMITSRNPSDLLEPLTIGLFFTFLVWWIVAGAIVWFWRAVGPMPFLLVTGAIGVSGFVLWNQNTGSSISPPPVATTFPTSVPRPTVTRPPTVVPRVSTPTQTACLEWSLITLDMDGQEVCVYGVVTDYRENWELRLTNFYFGDREQFFLVSTYRWSNQVVGECISANGTVDLNTYGTPYIQIYDLYDCGQIQSQDSPVTTMPDTGDHASGSLSPCSDMAARKGEYVSCTIPRAYCDYLSSVDGSPTFCDDRPYPNQDFQLVVFQQDWSDLDGSCLVVSGYLDTYNGVLQIQATSRSQVSFCE